MITTDEVKLQIDSFRGPQGPQGPQFDGVAKDSDKLGGKPPEYYTNPRNLLDNSNFQDRDKIVNQRSFVSGTEGGQNYSIDRWILQYSTYLHLHDGYIGIGGCWDIQQFLACKIEAGKTYTLAVLAKGETGAECVAVGVNLNGINVISNRFQNIGTDWNVYCATFIADKDYDAGKCKCVVGINDDNYQHTQTFVRWAALYEGTYTAETLPPYVPKGYAAELQACLRYAWIPSNDMIFRTGATSSGYAVNIIYPVTMAHAPSINFEAADGTSLGDGTVLNGTPSGISIWNPQFFTVGKFKATCDL
jgi:hypothetical protein